VLLADTTLAELNNSLVKEEEGLVACRGLVATYTGGSMGQGPTAAELNDNQVGLCAERMRQAPLLRRKVYRSFCKRCPAARARALTGTCV
jgi:hypothetical protein